MTTRFNPDGAMPADLEAIRSAIDHDLARAISALEQDGPEHAHALIARVYRWMEHYLAADGKRMHGMAVVLAYRACGGASDAAIMPVAAGLQLYHHHTLVHDDIYDEDSVRRAWPTAHVAFAGLFGQPGAAGAAPGPGALFRSDAVRCGAITAFAYGKICRAVAGHALLSADFPAAARLDVSASLELHDLYDNAGQLKDVYHEGDAMPDAHACLHNAWLKTGRLFEVCAYTGARLAGADARQSDALKSWAGQSALAYQMQDDLEDLHIDSEKGQGRGVGSDLLRCKPTYLYALAKSLATGADQEALLRWQGGAKDGLDTGAIIDILQRCGALQEARGEVERCLERADAALAQASFSASAREPMLAFSRYFVSPAYWRRRIGGLAGRAASLLA